MSTHPANAEADRVGKDLQKSGARVTGIALSEAVLSGAALRPQGFDDYFTPGVITWSRECRELRRRRAPDQTVCSDALGAAYEFLTGGTNPDDVEPFMYAAYPVLREPVWCPLYPTVDCWVTEQMSLLRMLAHVTDDHAWTREEAAALLKRWRL